MQIKKFTLLLLLIILFHDIFGNSNSNPENKPGISTPENVETAYLDSTITLDSLMVAPNEIFDDIFSEKFDSLMNDWYIRNAYNIDSSVHSITTGHSGTFCDEINHIESPIQSLSDSIYIQRLSSINSFIDLSYNESVRKMIEFYSVRIRNKVEIMLGLANYYFPMFEEIFDKYQIPLELKYMAIIESALNAKALSRVGASGLWQFMYGTGKIYGLEVNSFVDERRDPLKATEAAARYLNDLYKIYNDWHLVIAAYNCGPGNINKAIARSGGKRDYWSVYYRLPRETRGYVPAFISAAYIMNYYKYHNLTPRIPAFQITSDTIMVSDYLHLKQVSEGINIDLEILRELNPMFKKDIIPSKNGKTYPLVLPTEYVAKFIEKEKEVFALNREVFFPNNKIKEPEKITGTTSSTAYVPNIKGKTKVQYTVKTGEVIGQIAGYFNVKVADIKYWNNIKGNLIRVEQKLTIYVPNDMVEDCKDIETMSYNEKQRLLGKTLAQPIIKKDPLADPTYIYHTVKNGDNLWDIAKKYPGVTAEEIKSINNITNTRGLYIGQKLKIMKKS
jgi:membrane-bound lytic murein transglycosylase D